MLPPSHLTRRSQGPDLLGLPERTEGPLVSLLPPGTNPPAGPAQPSPARGQENAYLAHVEIEEGSCSHLDDKDQEEEGKVLGTQRSKESASCPVPWGAPALLTPAGTPAAGTRVHAGAPQLAGSTHQPQQAADLLDGTNAAQEAHEHGDGPYADEDAGPYLERAGGGLWGWREGHSVGPSCLTLIKHTIRGRPKKVEHCFPWAPPPPGAVLAAG